MGGFRESRLSREVFRLKHPPLVPRRLGADEDCGSGRDVEGACASDHFFDTRIVGTHQGLQVQRVSNRSLDRISETLGGCQHRLGVRRLSIDPFRPDAPDRGRRG